VAFRHLLVLLELFILRYIRPPSGHLRFSNCRAFAPSMDVKGFLINCKQAMFIAFCSMLLGSTGLADIYIYDGQVHDYYYPTTFTTGVSIDRKSPGGDDDGVPGAGTVMNVYGAIFEDALRGWEDSSINIYSGYVWYLGFYDRGALNVYGGEIRKLVGYANTAISGGNFGAVNIAGNAIAEISGGDIPYLHSWSSATTFIYGDDFAIDGIAVPYGEYFSITGKYVEFEPPRRLTGILANGDILDASFRIGHTARFVLIPEPFCIVLLGCGSLLLLRGRGR